MLKYNNFIVRLCNITHQKEVSGPLEHESYHEMMKRGRFDFPIGFYHVEKYHPRFNMPYHWHMEYELIRMLRGGFTISLNEETLHLVPGDIVFIRDGIVHGGVVDSDDRAFECLVFEPPKLLHSANYQSSDLNNLLNHTFNVRNHFNQDDKKIALIVRILFEEMQRENPGYELIVTGMLYTVFGLIIQEKQYTPVTKQPVETSHLQMQKLKKAFQLIDDKYAAPLTLSELSSAAGLSPNYFCKFFQKMPLYTPIEYLNQYRIDQACLKLAYTDKSITDIAYSCGFNNLSYFIKTFRRQKGISPGKFRQVNRK